MRSNIKSYFTVIFFVLVSTFFVWLPFLLKSNLWYGIEIPNSNTQYIYRNFDGPLYIIPAKTFYNKEAIEKIGLELALPAKYFAAHLPLYPFLIRIFAELFKMISIPLPYFKSMIFVNLAATVFFSYIFLFFYKKIKTVSKTTFTFFYFSFYSKIFSRSKHWGPGKFVYTFDFVINLFF